MVFLVLVSLYSHRNNQRVEEGEDDSRLSPISQPLAVAAERRFGGILQTNDGQYLSYKYCLLISATDLDEYWNVCKSKDRTVPNCHNLGLGDQPLFAASCYRKVKTGKPEFGACQDGFVKEAGLCW